MDRFDNLLKYVYDEENIISKIKLHDQGIPIERQWCYSNLIHIDNQIFVPYQEISLRNINHILQWIIGKILIFYYNRNENNDEIKIIETIVHLFIKTLKKCILKYERNNELLCEKNVNLIELISLFHYSRLLVDDEQIENITNENGLISYVNLHHILFHNMIEYENNHYIYIDNLINDFHVIYFKDVIINSKRFLAILLLTCNEKCNMNINEDSLINQLDIIKNQLNVYDVKLHILGLAGLNYTIYQDKETLTEYNWSKITQHTRLLVNLIHEFFYISVRSYSNDFSSGTPHRIESLEGGYLFEKKIFGTIKYNFWYDDSCCQLIFDQNTWLLPANTCLFTNQMLELFENLSQRNRKFRRNIKNIQFSRMEHGNKKQLTYE